jgi:hypothetical protein
MKLLIKLENKRTNIKTLISADDVFIRANDEKEIKLNQWNCYKVIWRRLSL